MRLSIPRFDKRISEFATEKFARDGIRVLVGKRVTAVRPDAVVMMDNASGAVETLHHGGFVVWSTGIATRPIITKLMNKVGQVRLLMCQWNVMWSKVGYGTSSGMPMQCTVEKVLVYCLLPACLAGPRDAPHHCMTMSICNRFLQFSLFKTGTGTLILESGSWPRALQCISASPPSHTSHWLFVSPVEVKLSLTVMSGGPGAGGHG